MKMKKLFGMLLLFLCTISFVNCSDDDDAKDPADTVTLNMMNEGNGKTILGQSDVYINNANNFKTNSCYIVDAGKVSGLGANAEPQLNSLAKEAAVVAGHLYQIYDRNVLRTFPSGNHAIQVKAGYYKAYVVAPITSENTTTGAAVKYALTYPEAKGLPEYEELIGNMDNMGDQIEYTLPKGIECAYSDYLEGEKNAFDIQMTDGKLIVRLLKSVDRIHGPYGTYEIYVRSGSSFSSIEFNVGMSK